MEWFTLDISKIRQKKIGGGERDAGVRNPTPPLKKPKKK